ncbi:MAG TPA: hypothetical protein VMX16_08170 [Terriglobia bacterium]|nr:hypothetical protein [Terriglobia bacterium]
MSYAPSYSGLLTEMNVIEPFFLTQAEAIERAIEIKEKKKLIARQQIPNVQSMPLNLSAEYPSPQRIFNAIQALYQSHNSPPARQIPDRLTALYRDAYAENQSIVADSVSQFADFFRNHRDLGLPKITLTPDGTLRVRWIHGPGNFTAIEFTGKPLAKLVAEIPREGGLTARYFTTEPIENILTAARAVGASFA